jgi:microcystin degradation protein MlrC
MFIGNPFTDVPSLRSYSFVVTDNDPELASKEALAIAENFWSHHESMQVPLVGLEEMSRQLMSGIKGTVGLVDAADATSSGASGDSNAILRELVRVGYKGRTLLPMVDLAAASCAFSAGIGETISVTLGGMLDRARFEPLSVTGTVRLLSDGDFRSESFGEVWRAGPTAVIESDNFRVVVSSRSVSLYDRSFFLAHGQNPAAFDAVVIKSPHCQPHMYADWCAKMILVDAPGSSSANLPYLGHTRCVRPVFPLDSSVRFEPRVEMFRRPGLKT